MRFLLNYFLIIICPFHFAWGQTIEKVVFDVNDSTGGHYLSISPRSNNIKGTLVLFNSFASPEAMLPETKLHNVAYANDLLTIAVSMKEKLYADSITIDRLNKVSKHVVAKYAVDTSTFVFAGYDFAGNIALRYAELAKENPSKFIIRPRAVIAIDSPVDLFGLWHWCERQIKRNTVSVGDAKYILELMTKEHGSIYDKKDTYEKLTPFNNERSSTGNEQFLKETAVRLYYDVDVEWHLKTRSNSLFDTNIPLASELVSRLLQLGNKDAEFVASKRPGMNSRGIRSTNSLSIVDEVECVHWIKNKLGIFDAHTWLPPYHILTTDGWQVERFAIPIAFAPEIPFKGVEDVRFAPGWGDEKSEQYWSYVYLWWLDGEQKIDAPALQKYLKAYYQGLVDQNIKPRNIPPDKVVPTVTSIKKVETESEDSATYAGTIRMLDYMTQKPMTLNCKVHVRNCKPLKHTAVLFEISPRPNEHTVWKDLTRIVKSFNCTR